jgi:hypothetical protein
VAIAQDVIDTLMVGRMTAESMTYLRVSGRSRAVDSFEAVALSLKAPRYQTTCEVCAIGAAAICAVGLYDQAPGMEKAFEEDDYNFEAGPMRRVLRRWFSNEQLGLIESAFERRSAFARREGASEDAIFYATQFGWEHDDDSDLLVAIMQNIVDNKGTFNPKATS